MSSRHRYRTAIPQVDAALTPELSRSSSVVSSMAPAAARKSNVQDVSLQRAPGAQCAPSPLRVASLGTQGRQQDGAPPAFRFVAPGQEPLPSSPSYSQLSPTSPTPSQEPSPTFSTTATLVNQPSMLFTPADPEVDDGDIEPNFCTYYFPRYLPQGQFPCLGCYSRPQWEGYRSSWMHIYREQHPNVNEENIERLSGVTGVRQRFGQV